MSAIKTFVLEATRAGADVEQALRGMESGELLWDEAIEQACPAPPADREKLLHQLLISHFGFDDETAGDELESLRYRSRQVDWTGFSVGQVVRHKGGADSGGNPYLPTAVITVLGQHGCGLLEVDPEARVVGAHVFLAQGNTPAELAPVHVAQELTGELKTLLKKVHGPSSAVKRFPDLLAAHLPHWRMTPAYAQRWAPFRVTGVAQ